MKAGGHNGGGKRINVPPGDNITSLVRYGMCLKNKDAQITADAIGLNVRVYRFMKKLFILKDHGVLNSEELKIVDEVIEEVNTTQMMSKAEKRVEEIIKQHWRARTMNGSNEYERKMENKWRKRFENTLFMVRETCTNNEEMEIPNLNQQEKENAIDTLIESIAGLSDLISKIQQRGKTNA